MLFPVAPEMSATSCVGPPSVQIDGNEPVALPSLKDYMPEGEEFRYVVESSFSSYEMTMLVNLSISGPNCDSYSDCVGGKFVGRV